MENLSRNKKLAYIAITVIILGLLGYAAYRAFLPSGETPQSSPEEQITGGGQVRTPGSGTGGTQGGQGGGEIQPPIITPEGRVLTQLTNFPVIAPAVNKEENRVLFYKKDGGDLFSIDFAGQNQEKVSNITVLGLFEAVWSRDKDRAAVFYLDGETIKGFLQIGSSTASLPQGIKSFVWSPDGKSIVYAVERSEKTDIILADANGRNPKITYTTPLRDAKLSWPTQDRIILETAPSGIAEGFLFAYTRSSGVFSRIIGPIFGLVSLWSPNGSQIASSITNNEGKNPKILIFDASGKLTFETTAATISQKCAWADEKELFCAIPQNSLSGYILPDDYLRGELNTSDRLMSINLGSGDVKELLDSGGLDISDIGITKKKDYVFFINRFNGTLWSLKLE